MGLYKLNDVDLSTPRSFLPPSMSLSLSHSLFSNYSKSPIRPSHYAMYVLDGLCSVCPTDGVCS